MRMYGNVRENRIRRRRTAAVFIFFALAFIYLEYMLKLLCFGTMSPRGALFTALFSLAASLLCSVLCLAVGRRAGGALLVILTALVTAVMMTQLVYYAIFTRFLTLYSVSRAGMVARGFWREAASGIWSCKFGLLALLPPLIASIALRDRLLPEARTGGVLILGALAFAAVQLTATAAVMASDAGALTLRSIYRESFVPELTVPNFGTLTTLRLDVRQLLSGGGQAETPKETARPSGTPQELSGAETSDSAAPSAAPPEASGKPPGAGAPAPAEYGYNRLDIDFEALAAAEPNAVVADMHRYFGGVEPTRQNEYTGLFKGKNLIWIVAESFSTLALNEEITPTLCRLAESGFVFNNFYNPTWTLSTSDGEYLTTTGLIPKTGVWSYYKSGSNHMPMAFGTMFSGLGYKALAYHDHDYAYYGRDVSMPNMGYEYKGVGNGLEITKQWPESDLEMMRATLPEYIGEDRFHVYYLTVSGHLNYSFSGNCMAAKHRDAVKNLGYSEPCRAYLACNIELDQAVEYLLSELERAGKLDDTVIVLSGDHYPYGLKDNEINELAGRKLDTTFENQKSTLIVWSGNMEKAVPVDKLCSSLDVMPTLANLFGLKYDSRLVIGRDILSDSEGLVIMSNRSFITARGRYYAASDTFVTSDGSAADFGYVRGVLADINDKFKYSILILERDYYRKVFPSG